MTDYSEGQDSSLRTFNILFSWNPHSSSHGSEGRDVEGGRGVNGVAERGISCLNSQVPQHEGVSLDAVTLLIIISGIEELPGKIGPLASHTFSI